MSNIFRSCFQLYNVAITPCIGYSLGKAVIYAILPSPSNSLLDSTLEIKRLECKQSSRRIQSVTIVKRAYYGPWTPERERTEKLWKAKQVVNSPAYPSLSVGKVMERNTNQTPCIFWLFINGPVGRHKLIAQSVGRPVGSRHPSQQSLDSGPVTAASAAFCMRGERYR